ncbi:MAG: right-handed parallel beta-helix repeat-containing protein [Planctomycetota bacterium]|jgi:hypothetical protein
MKTAIRATIALILSISVLASAANRTVPGQYGSIQAAIDDCNDGDTVIVAPGTYTGDGNRDITFHGKAITVCSSNPEDRAVVAATIIDCNAGESDPHRGFIFDSNEGSDSVLDGLTIINGYGPEMEFKKALLSFGGGILCKGASPVIRNCLIKNNTATARGGGILAYEDSAPQIIACTVTGNNGGGIFDDSGKVIDCTVTDNTSFGVVSMYGEVIGCTITHNRGVGMDFSWFIDPTVRDCVISHNSGGGVECMDSHGRLINCIISGNRNWGGIRAVGEINSLVIENCVIVGNTSNWPGGGIICGTELAGGPIISGTIIAHNRNTAIVESDGYGGTEGDPMVHNCLFYDNEGGDVYDYETDTTLTGADRINSLDLAWANIDGDPCFASLGYWDPNGTGEDANDDFWVDGDYHLKSQAGRYDGNDGRWTTDEVTSPCIDAGDLMSPVGREPFPNGGIINIGAYGGTTEASKSYFGKASCEIIVAGDINGDCIIDFKDFQLMALHWCESHGDEAEPGVSYEVGGCTGRSDTKTVSKAAGFSVEVRGAYIYFEDVIGGNCCPDKIEVQMALEGNVITIYEDEYLSSPCRCTCSYPTTAELGPFEDGTYKLEVYKREFFDGQAVSEVLLGSTNVTIGG